MNGRVVITIVAYAGLALVIIPSMLVFADTMSLAESKTLMALGTAVWFIFFGLRQYNNKSNE